MKRKMILVVLTLFLGVIFGNTYQVSAQSLTLFTPYTGLSVTPGETITYDIEVINNGSAIQHTSFEMKNFPKGWDYTIRSSGNNLHQLSVRPDDEEKIKLDITVPLEVNKGDYNFTLEANHRSGEKSSLPFVITVSEQGTFKTEFVVEQPNMQGHAESKFSYTASLRNLTAEEQHYSLNHKAPEGWTVNFKVASSSVTSVSVEPGGSEEVTIEITPAQNVVAGSYEIPVVASSGSTSEEVTLEAVVSGKYDLSLSTPEGNLSSTLTAGKEKTIQLVVENTGTVEVVDVQLHATTPPNWEVEFDQKQIDVLEAGESATIQARIKAPSDAMAGDYVTSIKAQAALASSEADFRMSVKTSTLWGFVALGIIIAVIAGLFAVFQKFGRR